MLKSKIINAKQSKQLKLQVSTHRHKRYVTDIILDEGFVLKNFVVEEGVLRPEIMTSLYLGKWLLYNNGIYKNKTVLDLGSGTGLVGVIAAKYGAKSVTCSDIDPIAVKNTQKNITKFNLSSKTKVVQGDLFENIKSKFDIIVFNHPFFGDTNIEYANLAMINKGVLLKKFLNEARIYLKEGGMIVMPYYHLAGPKNDPANQGPKAGYTVNTRLSLDAVTGIQKGPISIYELIPNEI